MANCKFSELRQLVGNAIVSVDRIDVQSALAKYKSNFLSLLKDPPRTAVDREKVRKAGDGDGVLVPGSGAIKMSAENIGIVLQLSDVLEINEMAAFVLVDFAKQETYIHPGLPVGPVAVKLYFESREESVETLKMILQGRSGHTWDLGAGEDLSGSLATFTDQLFEEGLLDRLLSILSELNDEAVLSKLQEAAAIASFQHRRKLVQLMHKIHTGVAECIFFWCAQKRADLGSVRKILSLLRSVKIDPDASTQTQAEVAIYLLLGIIYSFDVSMLDIVDSEELIQKSLPVFSDSFLESVTKILSNDQQPDFATPGLLGVLQLTWAVTLRSLSHSRFPGLEGNASLVTSADEALADLAVQNKVFSFLHRLVTSYPVLTKEEFLALRINTLIRDFVCLLPVQCRDLRVSGDETAQVMMSYLRQQEATGTHHPLPADLPREFEYLLNFIGAFYEKSSTHRDGGFALNELWWLPMWQQLPSGPDSSGLLSVYKRKYAGLHKFIQQSGENLPITLYVPYISMLTGLCYGSSLSASCCFRLLKEYSSHLGLTRFSFDHMFAGFRQYLHSLRPDLAATTHHTSLHSYSAAPNTSFRPTSTQTSAHAGPTMIMGHELDGMLAVLHLIETIVLYEPACAILIMENTDWQTGRTLFSLVGAPVPALLKGQLLVTLSQLCKNSDVALMLFNSLENSQIIPTTDVNRVSGLKLELEEIEAAGEEYPITRGFITLLSNLLLYCQPAGIGTGYRATGPKPYLDFVINSVFLRFAGRPYRSNAEKWRVAVCCLKLFEQEVRLLDLPQPTSNTADLRGLSDALLKSPGIYILSHMLTEGAFISTVLHIISEAVLTIEKYPSLEGETQLELAVLYSLRLLDQALSKQSAFLRLTSPSSLTTAAQLETHSFLAAAIFVPIERLLVDTSHKSSGKTTDHVLDIVKFVSMAEEFPEHALRSVRILRYVCRSVIAHSCLVTLLADETEKKRLLHGFVCCLDQYVDEPRIADDAGDGTASINDEQTAHVVYNLKCEILQLILDSVPTPSPNMGQFLLGLPLSRRQLSTDFDIEPPGVGTNPSRSCLHVLRDLLHTGVHSLSSASIPPVLEDTPKFACLTMRLLSVIVSEQRFARPVLRYFSETLLHFASMLPIKFDELDAESNVKPVKEADVACFQSWLLLCLAVYARQLSADGQTANLERLSSSLFGLKQSSSLNMQSTQTSMLSVTMASITTGSDSVNRVLSLIQKLELSHRLSANINIDELQGADSGDIEQYVSMFEKSTSDGVPRLLPLEISMVESSSVQRCVDVKRLHRALLEQSTRDPNSINESLMSEVLNSALTRNKSYEQLSSNMLSFGALCVLIESILNSSASQLTTSSTGQRLLFDLSVCFIEKILDKNTFESFFRDSCRTILVLIYKFSLSLTAGRKPLVSEWDLDMSIAEQSTSLLQPGNALSPVSFGAQNLKKLLKLLLDAISNSDGNAKSRSFLYAALIHLLSACLRSNASSQIEALGHTSTNVSGLLSADTSARESKSRDDYAVAERRLRLELVTIVEQAGATLKGVICREVSLGHDIGRVLALTALSSILSLYSNNRANAPPYKGWTSYLVSNGYLQQLLDSLIDDNAAILRALQREGMPNETDSDSRLLYIYRTKMAFFIKLCEHPDTALSLLNMGLLQKLTECTFLDCHPTEQRPSEVSSYNLSSTRMDDSSLAVTHPIYSVYSEVAFPALRLVAAVQSSLGFAHSEAHRMVCYFLLNHYESLSVCLQQPIGRALTDLNCIHLEETVLVTNIFRSAFSLSAGKGTPSHESIEVNSMISKFQRPLVMLLVSCCPSDVLNKKIDSLDGSSTMQNRTEARLMTRCRLMQIISNITSAFQCILRRSVPHADFCNVVFSPGLKVAFIRDMGSHATEAIVPPGRPAGLGILIHLVTRCVSYMLDSLLPTYRQHQSMLQNMNFDTSADKLAEICGGLIKPGMTSTQKELIARSCLQSSLELEFQLLTLHFHIIETSLFIIWRHLDFYLLHYVNPKVGVDADVSIGQAYSQQIQRKAIRNLTVPIASGAPDRSWAQFTDYQQSALAQIPPDAIQTLRSELPKCINNETFLKRLFNVQELWGREHSSCALLEVLIRRLQGLLRRCETE